MNQSSLRKVFSTSSKISTCWKECNSDTLKQLSQTAKLAGCIRQKHIQSTTAQVLWRSECKSVRFLKHTIRNGFEQSATTPALLFPHFGHSAGVPTNLRSYTLQLTAVAVLCCKRPSWRLANWSRLTRLTLTTVAHICLTQALPHFLAYFQDMVGTTNLS